MTLFKAGSFSTVSLILDSYSPLSSIMTDILSLSPTTSVISFGSGMGIGSKTFGYGLGFILFQPFLTTRLSYLAASQKVSDKLQSMRTPMPEIRAKP